MVEVVPAGGYARMNVVEIQNIPKFELKQEKRQRQQYALDYWAFNLEQFLVMHPQASEDASKHICLLTLGKLAFRSIPRTAQSFEDIKKVLQTYVDELAEEDFDVIIEEVLPGKPTVYYIEQLGTVEFSIRLLSDESHEHTDLLVDTVLERTKHLPQFNEIVSQIPDITETDARSRFIALRNGLQETKRTYGDSGPQERKMKSSEAPEQEL